ncbi:MAG: hypothetical protein Q7S49_01110 [bacterium]|nr:hypothetical protein [bacterium]
MNVFDIILLLGAGALIGIGTTCYLKQNQRGFEILVAALNFIAFLRCFGKRGEGAVEHELEERRKNLQQALAHRDEVRTVWHMGGYKEKNLPGGPMRVTWDRIESWVTDCQMLYDYATGLALIAGFGKTAMKVTSRTMAVTPER